MASLLNMHCMVLNSASGTAWATSFVAGGDIREVGKYLSCRQFVDLTAHVRTLCIHRIGKMATSLY